MEVYVGDACAGLLPNWASHNKPPYPQEMPYWLNFQHSTRIAHADLSLISVHDVYLPSTYHASCEFAQRA